MFLKRTFLTRTEVALFRVFELLLSPCRRFLPYNIHHINKLAVEGSWFDSKTLSWEYSALGISEGVPGSVVRPFSGVACSTARFYEEVFADRWLICVQYNDECQPTNPFEPTEDEEAKLLAEDKQGNMNSIKEWILHGKFVYRLDYTHHDMLFKAHRIVLDKRDNFRIPQSVPIDSAMGVGSSSSTSGDNQAFVPPLVPLLDDIETMTTDQVSQWLLKLATNKS
jgi:hypothetical protein